MHTMKKALTAAAILALLGAPLALRAAPKVRPASLGPAGPGPAGEIVRLSDETPVRDLGTELSGSRLVFVGESHDNPDHHAVQLQVIRSLADAGDKVAIGLEMFTAADQDALDRWVSGDLSEAAFLPIFARNWDGDLWPVYRDIFLYARAHGIPMIGLNVDRQYVRQVSREGIASVDPARVPAARAVSCDADPKYRDYIRRVMNEHSRGGNFVNFCEAQMLWDTTMAWRLVDFARANPDHTVVALAGSTHSWKHGIPEKVRRISALPVSVILPDEQEGDAGVRLTRDEADYLWRAG